MEIVLIGKMIKRVRPLTEEELEREGWDRPTLALELSGGDVIYASRDDEGNGPGTLFGCTKKGETFYVTEE